MGIRNWFGKCIRQLGFSPDSDPDPDDYEFAPISTNLGEYIPREEFVKMKDGVVAIEFIADGMVELYRVGLKEFPSRDDTKGFWVKGLWPINGAANHRDTTVFNSNTYGKEWKAFHVSFPINAKQLGVIEYC